MSTKYVSSISKFGEDYEIRDSRFDELETSASTLNKFKNIGATSEGQILVAGSDGNFGTSTDFLKPSQVLDENQKLISSVIPADMMTKSYLLDNVGEEDEAIKDQYIPAGMMTKAYLLDNVGEENEAIKDKYIPDGMLQKDYLFDKSGGSYTTIKDQFLPSELVKESELFDEDYYIKEDLINSSSFVKTVNGIAPTSGNVSVEHVELADNLYNADNSSDSDSFMLRTSGGSANLSTGDAYLSKIEGNSVNPTRVEATYVIDTTKSTFENLNTNINENKIKQKDDIAVGDNTFEYDGTKWVFNEETVSLSDYGISEPTIVNEVHTLTVSPSAATTECDLVANWGTDDVGLAVWKEHSLAENDGTFVFTYDGNNTESHKPWQLNGQTAYADLSLADIKSTFGIYTKSSATSTPILPSATYTATILSSTGITAATADIDEYHNSTIEGLYQRGVSKTFVVEYSPNETYMNKWCYTFNYSTTETVDWVEVPDQDLTTLGLAVEGTPATWDKITMAYTAPSNISITLNWVRASTGTIVVTYTAVVLGTIINVKPTQFNATSLNIFDKDSMVLAGKTIDEDKKIISSGTQSLAWVRVCGGVSNTANQYGYVVKLFNATEEEAQSTSIANPGTYIKGIWFSKTKKSEIDDVVDTTLTELDEELFEDLEDVGYIWKSQEVEEVEQKYIYANFGADDGYLYIALDTNALSTVADNLCIHPIWSNPKDLYFAPYELSSITFTNLKGSTDGGTTLEVLPINSYGMPAIGEIRDELNLEQGKYIQRIHAEAYSTQSAYTAAVDIAKTKSAYAYGAYVEGVSDYVYWVNDSNVNYTLYDTSVTPAVVTTQEYSKYTVNDWGHEYFDFADATHTFNVPCMMIYGKNLKDRLRVDVVTLSGDTITSDSQLTTLKELFGITALESKASAAMTYNYQRDNLIADDITEEANTVELKSNFETIIDGNMAIAFTAQLKTPTSADMEDGVYKKSFEWRLLFNVNTDLTLTLGVDSGSYTFLTDDGPATTVSCTAGNLYEISFALLTGSYIGVAVKEWTTTSST